MGRRGALVFSGGSSDSRKISAPLFRLIPAARRLSPISRALGGFSLPPRAACRFTRSLPELNGSSSSLSSTIGREEADRKSSDIQRDGCLLELDNRLAWEARGGEYWLFRACRMNVLEGEVSLISELYRSLDGFWGVDGSFEACDVVMLIFSWQSYDGCATYPAIRARPSGIAKLPGKWLPVFLSAATWAPPQRRYCRQSCGSDVTMVMFTACFRIGHG